MVQAAKNNSYSHGYFLMESSCRSFLIIYTDFCNLFFLFWVSWAQKGNFFHFVVIQKPDGLLRPVSGVEFEQSFSGLSGIDKLDIV